MDWMAAQYEGCSWAWSNTIRTARTRNSADYVFALFMAPISQGLEAPTVPARFTVHWRFTSNQPRAKLTRRYPSPPTRRSTSQAGRLQ